MNDTPLVSIIMPVYNRESTVRASIQSATKQTIRNLELIVVNDCSTDRTPEIIAELAQSDSRIKIMNNETNCGAAATRNHAIDAALGEFLAFIDSDDLWETDKIERQLNHIRDTGCDLCYSSYDYFDSNGKPVYKPYIVPKATTYDNLLKENVIGHSTVVLRKSVLNGLRYDKAYFHEDFVLWLKLLRAGISARGLPEILAHNRIGGRSDDKWKALKDRWQIYRNSEKLPIGKSCRYLACYSLAGIRKYCIKRPSFDKFMLL